jgi:hypothetical protein
MTDDKKTETAMDSTVKVQLASITLDNARLQKENTQLLDENKALKTQNVQLASVIETDLKADLKMKIMSKGDFKDADLEPLKIEQLQQIDETLSRSKGVDSAVSFKSIRTGNASGAGRMTIGDLYGKSRKQILEMGGTF